MHFSTFIGVAYVSCLGLLFPFVRAGLIAMFRFFRDSILAGFSRLG